MMHWREGEIVGETRRWAGAVQYAVRLAPSPGSPAASAPGAQEAIEVQALGYLEVVGELSPGDRVLLSASALVRGLGTGGLAFIVAAPERLPADPQEGPGHIVKARYTPQQQMVLAIDEQESPHHAAVAAAGSLDGMPVVVADLHSALPAVIAGVRADRPDARVVYLWTDGGALPAAFSMAVAGLREAGWLSACVTVGQAYGGDHEAVTLHSGLLAARAVLGADVCVVAQGPGNVGTGTPWGFTGVDAGEALNAVSVLGGHPIAALRVSEGDGRDRHRGLSHHSHTAYAKVALVPADVPLPVFGGELDGLVGAQVEQMVADSQGRLRVCPVDAAGLDEALAGSPVRLSTMGRGLDRDRAAFLASAAAGRHAARLL
ncbi:MAG: DUF3866 family protein [Micrococcales bacterium]|nr:DUF3866 family protein [Micrococcales bacterium]